MGQLKVLIVGASGFIGVNAISNLSKKYSVIPIYKTDNIDFTNIEHVRNILAQTKPNTVLNCLSYSAKHASNESEEVAKNLAMFYNFYALQDYYDQYINIGSGAEFDRAYDINLASESQINNRIPKDAYGFAKNIIARNIASIESKFINLRIFGCFASNEWETRLLKKFSNTKGKFLLENDRYFDYIGAQDFLRVVDFVIENCIDKFDCNCVYEQKYKLSELLKLFSKIHQLNIPIEIISKSDKNYTGTNTRLNNLPIKLLGLEKELSNYL